MSLPKNNLLISIIMPAFNVEMYIEASIHSVINQTYTNWELIVIDDGSTDNTAKRVKFIAQQDSRIIYLYQNNAKQARARNNGIQHAKGEILAFLDSDDLWLKNKLELSLSHFDLNNFDLIFTDAYFGNNLELEVINSNLRRINVPDLEYFGKKAIREFIEINRIPILTVLVKKSVVNEVNLFDEDCVPAEDFDLWLRLLKHNCNFKSIALPLSIYRIHESSSTSSDRLATSTVIQSIFKNFTKKELIEMKVEKHLRKWILRWMDFCLNENNIPKLKTYLRSFNLDSIMIEILFLTNKLLGFVLFKRLLKKIVKP